MSDKPKWVMTWHGGKKSHAILKTATTVSGRDFIRMYCGAETRSDRISDPIGEHCKKCEAAIGMSEQLYDSKGIPVMPGDLIRTPHFVEALRRKKQLLLSRHRPRG